MRAVVLILASLMAAGVMAEPAADLGERVFRQNCAVCHGDKGDGQSRARFGLDPMPRDFTSPIAAAELSRERMLNSVTHGRPGTAMVAWQGRLSPTEIEAVVDFIRSRFMTVAAASTATVAAQPAAAAVAKVESPVAGPHARGRKLFEEHCRVCHGDAGNGSTWTTTVLDPPPRNFTAPQSRKELTRSRMIASVTYGRTGTAMMPFKTRLSPADIEAVVDYIRAEFMSGPVIADAGSEGMGAIAASPHGTQALAGSAMAPGLAEVETHVDMNASFPNGLKGNYARGRAFYMGNCATCHGARGDGAGPRSGFIEPKPRNFIHPDSRRYLNRPALFKAIVTGKPGTVMPAWGTVLGPQQVADVAEFVFQDFIHPKLPQGSAADKKKAGR